MKIIGLCGGSGSGKGMVCSLFNELEIPSIDTDAVYRQLTSVSGPCLEAIEKEFGCGVISPEGSLDRRALASIVFNGDWAGDRRKRLNEISHSFILSECRKIIDKYRNNGSSAVIVDAPLLFESGFDAECDLTVCVVADKDLRLSRIIYRDGISRDEAIRRIESQIDDEILISKCDYTIYNNSDISSLRSAVNEMADKFNIKKFTKGNI